MTDSRSVSDMFDAYREALASHNPGHVLSLLAPDYEMIFVDSGFSMGRDEARSALGWDAGVRGRYTFEDIEIDGRTVSCSCIERNDFFDALGIDGIRSEASFHFDEDGLIDHQTYRELPGQESWQDALEPAVDWARDHRSATLEEIHPDGRMVFTEDAARKWVELLEAWAEA